MGLGFSPLAYRLQLNSESSTVQSQNNTLLVLPLSINCSREHGRLENKSSRHEQLLGVDWSETNACLRKRLWQALTKTCAKASLRFHSSQDLRICKTCGRRFQLRPSFSVDYKWSTDCDCKWSAGNGERRERPIPSSRKRGRNEVRSSFSASSGVLSVSRKNACGM